MWYIEFGVISPEALYICSCSFDLVLTMLQFWCISSSIVPCIFVAFCVSVLGCWTFVPDCVKGNGLHTMLICLILSLQAMCRYVRRESNCLSLTGTNCVPTNLY